MTFLKKPVLSKTLQRYGNENVKVGVAAMQGYRGEMEDAHVCILSLPKHTNTSFFAVFDGHCGDQCSEWLSKNLATYMDELVEFDKASIEQACLKADANFYATVKDTLKIKDSGSTAVFALVTYGAQNRIIVGHIGDSRALLINTSTATNLLLSVDHKPQNIGERARIIDAGWSVYNNRVGGQLAMSRAFGDFEYKNNIQLPASLQAVIAVPDIVEYYTSQEEMLLLACDGITDVMSLDVIGKFVCSKISTDQPWDPAWTVVLMEDKCINLHSHDNMTGMLISFGDGQGYGDTDPTTVGYLPGPWLGTVRSGTSMEYGELIYCLAYNRFARKHGYNTAESVAMQKLNEAVGLYAPMADGLDPKPLQIPIACVPLSQYQNMLQELDE